MHLYSREQVWMFVEKEVITQEQFAEIVGDSE
ncbi:MAG: XkdX family protein [Bacteroidales bacterium]|nr:XkdX family protein [Candidatus Equimonas faecalis]